MKNAAEFPSASELIDAIDDAGCITTNRLAAQFGVDRSVLRDVLVRLAACGDLALISHGWDYSLAWASPEQAENIDMGGPRRDTEPEPWHMDKLTRFAILREAREIA